MSNVYNRRKFIGKSAYAGAGFTIANSLISFSASATKKALENNRIGMIGLDTSHCVAFTKALNAADAGPEYKGYKIVAAYPKGSNDIQSRVE